ncbi:MAG: hypothetical protein IKH30_06735 [Clostridia bacterium]|nr:hypothetical protein [Clostridia bacterium]
MIKREVRMPALKTEEAALLPALPRQSLTGGAALRTALRSAEAIANKQTADAAAETGTSSAERSSVPPRPVSRAALNHALRRGRR